LAPEGISGQVNRDWDFGYGWYRPGVEVYASFYSYRYGQWWDDCPWCDQFEYSELENSGAFGQLSETVDGKISQRNDHVYPYHPYQHVIPSDNSTNHKIDTSPPARNTEQKSLINNQKDSKPESGNRSSGKIKRRSRR
jgi:hypothetical protein